MFRSPASIYLISPNVAADRCAGMKVPALVSSPSCARVEEDIASSAANIVMIAALRNPRRSTLVSSDISELRTSWSAEGKYERLRAGIEKVDLEVVIRDGKRLANQLI